MYRTCQRFGAAHVIDMLRGADTAKVRQFGHESVSTYGIGADLDAWQWRGVCRQLVSGGLLEADIGDDGAPSPCSNRATWMRWQPSAGPAPASWGGMGPR